jgi:hypothetical protein
MGRVFGVKKRFLWLVRTLLVSNRPRFLGIVSLWVQFFFSKVWAIGFGIIFLPGIFWGQIFIFKTFSPFFASLVTVALQKNTTKIPGRHQSTPTSMQQFPTTYSNLISSKFYALFSFPYKLCTFLCPLQILLHFRVQYKLLCSKSSI